MMPRKFRTKHAQIRERRRFARVLVLGVVGILLLLCGALFSARLAMMRWQTVVVHTDGQVATEEVARVFENLHTSTYLGFIPKDTIFYIPRKSLEENLMEHFLRIRAVHIVREGATLLVTLSERTPSALWCGDVVPTRTAEGGATLSLAYGTCYVADAEGFLYLKEQELRPASQVPLPHYYSSLVHAEPLGQHFVPAQDFAQLQHLYAVFQDSPQHGLWALLIDDERDMELYLSSAMRILASRSDTPEHILKRTNALYDAGVLSHDTNATSTYIDMRFGDKVYIGQ